jgi:hypothetical protein
VAPVVIDIGSLVNDTVARHPPHRDSVPPTALSGESRHARPDCARVVSIPVRLSPLQLFVCLVALALGGGLAGVVGASAADPDPTPGVQLHLDTMSNTVVGPSGTTPSGDTPDSSGHTLTAKATGYIDKPPPPIPGRFGNALKTDYDQDGVVVTNNPVLEPGTVTVMAWVKGSASPGANRVIVAKGGDACPANAYRLATGGGGGLMFSVYRDVDATNVEATPELPAATVWNNQWHAVAGTYDGSTVRLWVDGQPVEAFMDGHSGPILYNTPHNELYVGDYKDASGACSPTDSQFHGFVDEVRVYGRALSDTELQYLQRSDHTSPPNLPVPTNPPPPHASLTTQKGPDGKVVISAAGSTNAARFLWDLNGDGKPDYEGGPGDPFARLTLPQGGTRTVCVTVISATGAQNRTCIRITIPRTKLPPKIVPQVAVFTESPSLFTPKPTPVCKQTTVLQGIVEAKGCFIHVTSLNDVPAKERASARKYYGNAGLPPIFVKICEDPKKADLCQKAKKLFVKEYSAYISTKTIKINGMSLTPTSGGTVVVDPVSARVFASRGRLNLGPFPLRINNPVNLDFTDLYKHTGHAKALDYTGVTKALLTFDARRGIPIIGGFPLNAGGEIAFASDHGIRKSKVTLHITLPKVFDAFGKGEQPSGAVTLSATNKRAFFVDNLFLKIPHASIGGVGLSDLSFTYTDAGDRAANCPRKYWHATATIQLGKGPKGEPGAGFRLTPPPTQNGVAFCAGGFDSAGGEITFGFPIPPPQLFPGVFLDNINFAIKLHPTLIRGGAQISAAKLTRVNGTLLAVFATPWEPYTLTKFDAGRELQDIAPRTFTSSTFAVGGAVAITVPSIGELDIAHGALYYSYPDYLAVGARVDVQLGIFVFHGGLGGELNARTRKFQVNLNARICIRGVKIACAGGLGIVSSRGVVACLNIGPLHPGVGLHTNLKFEVWIIDGCKPSHYWERDISHARARAAAAGSPLSFRVAKGESVKNLRLDGIGGAPKVLVQGPGGQSLTVAGDDLVHSGSLVGLRTDDYKATFLGVSHGKPGTYTITPLAGSVPLGKLSGTRAGYDTHFTGRVTGRGNRRTLHYDTRKRGGGQRVTFFEDGLNVMHELGTSTGGRGTLHFKPADGRRGVRTIVARATVDGVAIRDQVIARYRFGGTVRTGRPSRVTVQRRGSSLLVRWTRAAGAVRYGVLVNRSGGSQQRYELSARHRTLRIRHYPLTEGGRVSVSARGLLGDWGRPRRSRSFKATRRADTILVTRPHRR